MKPTFWISCGIIWVIFAWFYRDYRLDKFRQSLFALRDELFDFARVGNISFDHDAYGMLRSSINGTIRRGHQQGLIDFLFLVCAPNGKLPSSIAFHSRWKDACESLPESTQKVLKSIRARMHFLVVEQVIFTSAFLFLSVIVIGLWLVATHITARVSEWFRRTVGTIVSRWADRIDADACSQMTGCAK